MPRSLIALQIFMILLPGFASAYIVQLLVARRTQTDLERITEALLYSFLIYVAYSLLRHGHLPFHIAKDPIDNENTILWDTGGIALLALVTLGFAFAVTAYYKHDGNRILRLFDTKNPRARRWLGWLILTERTTRNSIWNDVFQSEYKEGQYVQAELADGRRLLGVVFYYSDSAEEKSLYLTRAAWLPEQGDPIEIKGGILLTQASGITSIMLLDSDKTSAQRN